MASGSRSCLPAWSNQKQGRAQGGRGQESAHDGMMASLPQEVHRPGNKGSY